MGTYFGHPYKKFDSPVSLPIENQHHIQILVRIDPTVVATLISASSDLIRSTILRIPNSFYFMQLLIGGHLFWPFFTFGHPYKKFNPPMLDHRWPNRQVDRGPILGQICPAVWPSIKDKHSSKQADRTTNICTYRVRGSALASLTHQFP